MAIGHLIRIEPALVSLQGLPLGFVFLNNGLEYALSVLKVLNVLEGKLDEFPLFTGQMIHKIKVFFPNGVNAIHLALKPFVQIKYELPIMSRKV